MSRNTLRQALTILNQDGYIYKKQGKGTFVSYDRAKKQADKIYNFLSEDALEKITDIRIDYNMGLPTKIAQIKLHLADEEEVLASNNVYVGENDPIGQSFLQIPLDVLAENQIDTGNEEQLLEFMNKGLYHLAVGSEMSVQLMEADEQVVPFLKIEPGTPVLILNSCFLTKKQKPYARIKYYFCSGKISDPVQMVGTGGDNELYRTKTCDRIQRFQLSVFQSEYRQNQQSLLFSASLVR